MQEELENQLQQGFVQKHFQVLKIYCLKGFK